MLVGSTGIKGTNLEDKFLFHVFADFSIIYMERKATNCHVFLRMGGRLKCHSTALEASLSLISTSLRCSRKRSPNLRPISPLYIFLLRYK